MGGGDFFGVWGEGVQGEGGGVVEGTLGVGGAGRFENAGVGGRMRFRFAGELSEKACRMLC